MRIIKILLLTPLFFYIFSCQREGFISDSSAKLRFSLDTVYFDTVFTTLSTVTRRFTVINPYKDFIKISSVNLAGGNSSVFKINFDGLSGTEFKNIEIPPKDSLFMFVEATLDPNNSGGILLQQDSIIFVTNNNTQDIDLCAWGQDVHILRDSLLNTQTWTNDKPYLILDAAGIDSLNVLTIEEGTRIYFHRNAAFYVFGTIIINGTKDNPVIIKGDRLEQMYSDISGQWGYIDFRPGSKNNSINYAEISGGTIGLALETILGRHDPVDLSISNTKIQHMSAFGLRAADAKITGYNNLITNCGICAIAMEIGGYYEFNHTTIANWFRDNTRNTPSIFFSNYIILKDKQGRDSLAFNDLEKAYFSNSIVYGSNQTEIAWNENESAGMEYKFENCLIKYDTTDVSLKGDPHFINCINYKDPKFLNIEKYDFHFDTLEINISPARDFGKPEIGAAYPVDLDGVSRTTDGKPDLGAYEFLLPD